MVVVVVVGKKKVARQQQQRRQQVRRLTRRKGSLFAVWRRPWLLDVVCKNDGGWDSTGRSVPRRPMLALALLPGGVLEVCGWDRDGLNGIEFERTPKLLAAEIRSRATARGSQVTGGNLVLGVEQKS